MATSRTEQQPFNLLKSIFCQVIFSSNDGKMDSNKQRSYFPITMLNVIKKNVQLKYLTHLFRSLHGCSVCATENASIYLFILLAKMYSYFSTLALDRQLSNSSHYSWQESAGCSHLMSSPLSSVCFVQEWSENTAPDLLPFPQTYRWHF